MKKLIAILLVAALAVSICACVPKEDAAAQSGAVKLKRDGTTPQVDTFSVGFGRMDISPKEAVPISGISANSTDRMSTTIHDTLMVTCIAMTDAQNNTRLFFTIDLQRPDVSIFDMAATALEESTGISEEHMYFTATHTHSGPDTYNNSFPAIATYKGLVLSQTIEAGIAALEDRKPADIYYSQVEAEKMNSIRHYTNVTEDGELIYWGDQYRVGTCSVNTTTKHVYEADATMFVLRIAREDDKDIVLANWRAHPHLYTSTTSFRISADFVGSFRTAMEAMYDCYFAYYQGAAGNTNATSKIAGELLTKEYGEYGRIMAEYALEAMKNETKLENEVIDSRQNQRVFEQNHTTDHLVPYAEICRQMWKDGYSNAEATAYGEPYGVYGPVAAASIISRAKKGKTITSELNAVTLGDQICIVTAPHELFDTNSQWLEGESPYDMTLTFGYTNGMNGYVPSAQAYEYGCYEANCSNLMPGGGEQIQEEFLVMLEDMYG